MKLKRIDNLSIAKEKYNFNVEIKQFISYEKWVNFIETHQDYYIWLENTESGKETLANLDKIPESFREGVLKGHNKSRVCAEYNAKKEYYEIIIDYVEQYGKVSTTFMKRITKDHLRKLLDMANYLNAYLLNNGNEIIDEEFIENYK